MKLTRVWTALTLAAAFLVGLADRTEAQGVTTGAIAGIVSDASGAPIENASVKLVNTLTGFTRSATTTAGGRYRFGSLEVGGGYEVTATAIGFAPPVHALAVTSDGYSLRFALDGFVEPSTRAGRRYAKAGDGVEVVGVAKVTGSEIVIAATRAARAMLCRADEINFLSGPGRGVILIKIDFPDDKVIGAIVSTGDRDLLTVETTRGGEQTISTTKYEVTGRGGKGRELLQRGGFTKVVPADVPAPVIEGAGG